MMTCKVLLADGSKDADWWLAWPKMQMHNSLNAEVVHTVDSTVARYDTQVHDYI